MLTYLEVACVAEAAFSRPSFWTARRAIEFETVRNMITDGTEKNTRSVL